MATDALCGRGGWRAEYSRNLGVKLLGSNMNILISDPAAPDPNPSNRTSDGFDNTAGTFIWQPLPHARAWCPYQGRLPDGWGNQQHTWPPGHQCVSSRPRSFNQGQELDLNGSVAITGCVAPLIFPGAKSTVASSLIKVT